MLRVPAHRRVQVGHGEVPPRRCGRGLGVADQRVDRRLGQPHPGGELVGLPGVQPDRGQRRAARPGAPRPRRSRPRRAPASRARPVPRPRPAVAARRGRLGLAGRQHQAEPGQQRRLARTGRSVVGVQRAGRAGRPTAAREHRAVLGIGAAQDDPVVLRASSAAARWSARRSRRRQAAASGSARRAPAVQQQGGRRVSRTGASASVTGRSSPSATGPVPVGSASGTSQAVGLEQQPQRGQARVAPRDVVVHPAEGRWPAAGRPPTTRPPRRSPRPRRSGRGGRAGCRRWRAQSPAECAVPDPGAARCRRRPAPRRRRASERRACW